MGAFLDESLNLKQQILWKCRAANFNLQLLRQIRKYLTDDAAKTFALGTVISHLDYANSLYSGLPKGDIKKLQHIQDFAVKEVLQKPKHSSSTEALKLLYWLPVRLKIPYKICVLVLKCKQKEAPIYLQQLLTPKSQKRA